MMKASMSPIHTPRSHKGMTLIELMVAISVFSLLGVLSWRATSTMVDSREHMTAELTRWRNINRTMQLIEVDITQSIVEWPTAAAKQTKLEVSGQGKNNILRFVRPDQSDSGLSRRSYQFDRGFLVRRQSTVDGDNSRSRDDKLLNRVKSLSWQLLSVGGGSSEDQRPDGVILELELEDAGIIKRIFPLR